MLLKRVDIVTGGASAVYGSDAVTGVVNFVMDNNFNGLKLTGQSGISTYSDDPTFNIGIAAGRSLFGGRAHVEASYQHFNDPGIAAPIQPRVGPRRLQHAGRGSRIVGRGRIDGQSLAAL